MAETAFAELPAQFRDQMGDVVLQVEDFATPEQLASVDITDRWHLSGLYEGEPLPDQSIWQSGQHRVRSFLVPASIAQQHVPSLVWHRGPSRE